MRQPREHLATVAVLVVLLTGCAPTGETVPEPETSRPPFQTTTPGPVGPSAAPTGSPVSLPDARRTAIEADLAARGVSGEPTFVSAEAITWSSGALGCAQPGQSYTQALIDGMRVIVTVAGESYDYRFGETDQPVLCER